ncbi:MAG TPA: response regulator [Myxococcaceae bacterium]|nr:response regulator [Myxococcaceae bacterium]
MSDRRRCKILVVEDDDDIRDSLKELLEEEGYRVDTAANGQQALVKLQEQELPQLILLDLMMPVMDGWQFQKELRAVPSLARLPVIVISASKFSREPLNAAAFIPKPLDAGVLLETIESFLSDGQRALNVR